MPSLGSVTPGLCVNDVLAFDDAQLVEYMKRHLRPDGGFDLESEGWERLSKDRRDQLAEKLRFGAQKVNDAVQSRPVDADQLAARLYGVASNQEAEPQELSRRARYDRTPTEDVDWDAEEKRSETISYNTLVNDGGRPVYPISRLEEVFPGVEDETLRPWQEDRGNCRQVFEKQLYRWEMFRRWQHHNREPDEAKDFAAFVEEQKREDREGTEICPTPSQYLEQLRDSYTRKQQYNNRNDGEAGFLAYIEEQKRRNFQSGGIWPGMTEEEYMQMLRIKFNKKQAKDGTDEGDEGFAAFVEEDQRKDIQAGRRWPGMSEDEYLQMLRNKFNELQRFRSRVELDGLRKDNNRGGFPEYVAEAKRRLMRHGFTKPFEFNKDPMQQDKWTTWIEYLNYEYSWLDRHARLLSQLRPKYDAGWQKLVDSGVLRPGETAAGFCTMESAMRSQSERDAAEKAVEDAKTAAMAILKKAMIDPHSKSTFPKPVRIQMMEEANSRFQAARASSREVTRRCDLISKFVQGASRYKRTEEDLALQSIRLQWVMEQIPLVEAEMRQAKAAENSPSTSRKTKRRLENDEGNEDAGARSLKRKKLSRQAGSLPDDLGSSTLARASKCRKESRGGRRSSNHQQDTNDIKTISDGTSQSISVPPRRKRAGVARDGLKIGGPRHRQSRSPTNQLQEPLKQPRRSPRFTTAQNRPSEDALLPSGVTRTGLRPRRKG